ncbi:hypothetical protein M404DRAFT_23764 [Pisolithus tinctorius Marx 270]|uniref:Uncharacterized protein n=1 Tax=Pisolithus tinctorius Marx 270 TaxID=870435 RepID=A0A0C3PH21_PISTI|nr:hypothetical protein M404DRAFT_23764 [Pisolithus tinctorius Marx 270]
MEGIQDQITDLQNALDTLHEENYRLNDSLRNAQDTITAIEGQCNQWNALPANVIQRRIEVMANLGQYASDRAKFSEWWVKMKLTLPNSSTSCAQCPSMQMKTKGLMRRKTVGH